jgi:hypothetical protein
MRFTYFKDTQDERLPDDKVYPSASPGVNIRLIDCKSVHSIVLEEGQDPVSLEVWRQLRVVEVEVCVNNVTKRMLVIGSDYYDAPDGNTNVTF